MVSQQVIIVTANKFGTDDLWDIKEVLMMEYIFYIFPAFW